MCIKLFKYSSNSVSHALTLNVSASWRQFISVLWVTLQKKNLQYYLRIGLCKGNAVCFLWSRNLVLRYDLYYLPCYKVVSWFRCKSPGFRHRGLARNRNWASSSALCCKKVALDKDFLQELRLSVLSARTFYQRSILLIWIPLVLQGRAGASVNLQTKQCSRIPGRKHCKEKYLQI